MPTFKLMIARFPYGRREDPDVTDWLLDQQAWLHADPRFEVVRWRKDDTPITMTRNESIAVAQRHKADFLLMVDSDMSPDCELGDDPTAKPFLKTSIEFMLSHEGPSVVAAPYCGPPPHENIYVFHWKNLASDHPNLDLELGQYSREQAAIMAGIQEVAALPTGIFLLDMRALDAIDPPYFYYEFEGDGERCHACATHKPGIQARKASTEDVTFTRDLSLAGVKIYCNWDAWAGHWKWKKVRKPRVYTVDLVSDKLRKAFAESQPSNERLVEVGAGGLVGIN